MQPEAEVRDMTKEEFTRWLLYLGKSAFMLYFCSFILLVVLMESTPHSFCSAQSWWLYIQTFWFQKVSSTTLLVTVIKHV
jgi:hypothetical protein